MVGGYAVPAVPPSKHKIFANGADGSETYFTYETGETISTSTPTTIDAKTGTSVYLRILSSMAAIDPNEAPPGDGKSEAGSCDLTPGGALR